MPSVNFDKCEREDNAEHRAPSLGYAHPAKERFSVVGEVPDDEKRMDNDPTDDPADHGLYIAEDARSPVDVADAIRIGQVQNSELCPTLDEREGKAPPLSDLFDEFSSGTIWESGASPLDFLKEIRSCAHHRVSGKDLNDNTSTGATSLDAPAPSRFFSMLEGLILGASCDEQPKAASIKQNTSLRAQEEFAQVAEKQVKSEPKREHVSSRRRQGRRSSLERKNPERLHGTYCGLHKQDEGTIVSPETQAIISVFR